MKNTLKKLLAIVMVLTMLFAFAGCGSKKVITVGYTIYEPMNY